jgi:YfiH family protein
MFFEKKENLFIGQFQALYSHPALIHGISTRPGGISRGSYSSLNIGPNSSDQPGHIQENRHRFFKAAQLSPDALAIPQQIHGDRIARVFKSGHILETDGLITDTPGIVLSIQIADCLPVFLHDPQTRCIGLVHAGWRGSSRKIASKAVREMQTCFRSNPEDIHAYLGPSIGPCCYQIGSDVADNFSKEYVTQGHLDLWKCNTAQLTERGINPENITISHLCTMCHSDLFFSHRASGNNTGRMMAILGLQMKMT